MLELIWKYHTLFVSLHQKHIKYEPRINKYNRICL